jgi:hypothetical protein
MVAEVRDSIGGAIWRQGCLLIGRRINGGGVRIRIIKVRQQR